MRCLRLALRVAPLLAAFAAPAPGVAQAWPDRPVTIIANFGPGSSRDVLARLIAPTLQAAWGQPVVVDNVVGAAGTIAIIHRAAVAALAEADVRARLETLGVQIVGSSPAELRSLVEREIPRMAGVLSRAGIRPE